MIPTRRRTKSRSSILSRTAIALPRYDRFEMDSSESRKRFVTSVVMSQRTARAIVDSSDDAIVSKTLRASSPRGIEAPSDSLGTRRPRPSGSIFF